MRKLIFGAAFIAVLLALSGCGPRATGEKGTEIISAKEAIELQAQGAVLVDAQSLIDYRKGHADGSVNISRADIVVNTPFANMLAPAAQIEEALGTRGIGNKTQVVAYDNNKNMDAARLWWTLKVYGHDNVKVVSGGFEALKKAGVQISTTAPTLQPTAYKAGAVRNDMIASKSAVKSQVNEPADHTVILDTRSSAEYFEGTIPGAINLDFAGNNFADGLYRPVQHIRIRYLEQGIDYDDQIIMYCKTSIRAAQTYLALFNAGYRDLKIYDGAWLEWTASPANPIQIVEPTVLLINSTDNS